MAKNKLNEILRLANSQTNADSFIKATNTRSGRKKKFIRPTGSPFSETPFISKLFAPTKLDAFYSEFFEKKPFMFKGDHRSLHEALRVGHRDLLKLPAPPRLVRLIDPKGTELKPELVSAYMENHKLEDYLFKEKGSIILNNLLSFDSRYKSLSLEFLRVFGVAASVNCYITPPRSQTFRCHWDDHDVFMMQVEGKKNWSIFEPLIELPLQNSIKCNLPMKTIEQFTLRPGNFVYLPRGLGHMGLSDEHPSVHLTVGLQFVRYVDLIKASLDDIVQICENDIRFRRAVFASQVKNRKESKDLFQKIDFEIREGFRKRDQLALWKTLPLEGVGKMYGEFQPTLSENTSLHENSFTNPDLRFQRVERPAVMDHKTLAPYSIRILLGNEQLVIPKKYKRALSFLFSETKKDLFFSLNDVLKLSLKHDEAHHLLESLLRASLIEAIEKPITTDQGRDFSGYIPISVSKRRSDPKVILAPRENIKFDKPFFSQSIGVVDKSRAIEHSLSSLPLSVPGNPSASPAAFIYHVTRCGSTLLSQLLACQNSNLVISEAGPEGAILSRSFEMDDEKRIDLLKRLFTAFLQARTGKETRVIFKFTSWTFLQANQLAKAFPNTPWVFLHRDPREVLSSLFANPPSFAEKIEATAKAAGVPFDSSLGELTYPEKLALMLTKLYDRLFEQIPSRGLILDYKEIRSFPPDHLWSHLNISVTKGEKKRMIERMKLYSKNSGYVFDLERDEKNHRVLPLWSIREELMEGLLERYKRAQLISNSPTKN